MNYVEIIFLVFGILGFFVSICCFHFSIFGIIGLFARKKFPKAKVIHKYGCIIPARNEEKVVGNLIKSIQQNKYPQDKLQIFVIAHNCTDKTAEIARSLGATVYEYNNPNENTMGYAFKYLFEQIERDFGTQNYDGFIMFNADNVLNENYIKKMNDAFDFYGCKDVVTSYRNSKNFGSNVMSGCYGVFFLVNCKFESRGRTVCGCSTRVQGTGYVISSKLVENGWPYVTLTEDWEFSADQVIRGNKIRYCDEAEFYDEQPTKTKVMLRQRLRWSKGHLLVCFSRFKDLIHTLFSKKSRGNRFSVYDIAINCTPLALISLSLFLLQAIFLAFCPLFDGIDVGVVWRNWAISFGIGAGMFYVFGFLMAVLIFATERKRIVGVTWWRKIAICFVYPIFMFVAIPLDAVALFSKVGWKEIPHSDTTSFEKIKQTKSAKKRARQGRKVSVLEESIKQ